jgi:tRNA pseudouridine55 synthase
VNGRSLSLSGVLVIDKPPGMTSHDVVAAARRLLKERRIGHTGTLDPLATGVLPLACGRATRLVRFLISSDKDYEAVIRFGVSTDTCDITGTEVSRTDVLPTREAVEAALAPLRGTYLQTPPAYSAKKVGGLRAYALARRSESVTLAPVRVTAGSVELLDFTGPSARLAITCSAGFYVRSFAQALGESVGTGACLESLRRTRSGEFGLDRAVDLDQIRTHAAVVAERWIPLDALLTGWPVVRLNAEGRRRVAHGQEVGPAHQISGMALEPAGGGAGLAERWVRLVDEQGHLVALGTPGDAPGSLHPATVLI